MVVTVLSAMPCGSWVKLVAIENTDTAVLKIHTIHHTTIGLRSHVSRSSTSANSITNTGAQAGTFTVTVGGVQAFNGTIQPGQSQSYSRTTTLGNCTAGQSVPFAVVASVSNSCGNAEDTETVNVACNAAPCVTLTADRVPTSACPGDQVTVSGTVQNCSTVAETIVVTVNNEQVFSQSVAAGQSANWTKSNSASC